MTLEDLINEYAKSNMELVDLEEKIAHLETHLVDWTSKDTNAKLLAKLSLEHHEYEELKNQERKLKVVCSILSKKISIVQDMITSGILTNPNQIDSFIRNITANE